MSRIFITGDVHGHLDLSKLTKANFPTQSELTLNDYLIQLGDLGLLWFNNKTQQYLMDFYTSRRYTLLWIDGNHDNFNELNQYPIENWNGGKIHRIAENIIHLMRGQVFTINNHTWFTLGGGESIDRQYRTEGIDWWREEELNFKESLEAIDTLKKHNYNVDYVLTHSAPTSIKNKVSNQFINNTSTTENFLQNLLDDNLSFNHWYIGHYHLDTVIDNYSFVYNKILEL